MSARRPRAESHVEYEAEESESPSQQESGCPRTHRQNLLPPRVGTGGRKPKRFITYEELARFFGGVKVDTVRHWVSKGKLDPEDLESVVQWGEKRRQRRG